MLISASCTILEACFFEAVVGGKHFGDIVDVYLNHICCFLIGFAALWFYSLNVLAWVMFAGTSIAVF